MPGLTVCAECRTLNNLKKTLGRQSAKKTSGKPHNEYAKLEKTLQMTTQMLEMIHQQYKKMKPVR
jgi:hypothetical protein